MKKRIIGFLLAVLLSLNIFSGTISALTAIEKDSSLTYKSGIATVSIIKVPTIAATDKKVTVSAHVTDVTNGLNTTNPVKLWYRTDKSLPWGSLTMNKDSTDNTLYTATVEAIAYEGQAKHTRTLFTDTFYYYVEVTDSASEIFATPENTAEVKHLYGEVRNADEVPYILITEMVASSTESSGGDRYEFVELYNNSKSPIDLSGYELRYMNAPSSSNPLAHAINNPDNRNVVIKPGETFTIWISTYNVGDKGKLPIKDFEDKYYSGNAPLTYYSTQKNAAPAVEFTEDKNIGYVHFAGMPNSGQHRGWGIYTNTGELVVEAYFNVNNDTSRNTDVTADMGILYRYPTDGGKKMQKIAANVIFGSPGRVLDFQVPDKAVNLPVDAENPVITYRHSADSVSSSEANGNDYEIWATATDDTLINTFYIYYKYSSASYTPEQFTYQSMLRDGETYYYCAYMDYGNFIRQNQLEFYMEAKDIVGNVTRMPAGKDETYVVNIIGFENEPESNDLRSNIRHNMYIGGRAGITATNAGNYEVNNDNNPSNDFRPAEDLKVELDGAVINGTNSGELYAFFVYEVIETDYNFKNGITVGSNILKTFEISGRWTTYTVRIPIEMLVANNYTVGIHGGNRYTPFYDQTKFNNALIAYRAAVSMGDLEAKKAAARDFVYGDYFGNNEPEVISEGYNLNRDDYKFRNPRLVMSDGRVLRDANPDNGDKFAADKAFEPYSIGDGNAASIRQYFFKFNIPDSYIDSKYAEIDTTGMSEGEHTLKLTNTASGTERFITFFVDNTAPEVSMNFADGDILKGLISLNPQIVENGSGIKSRVGYLDGQRIGLPYTVYSGQLDPGVHTLLVTITDKVGNSTTISTTFETKEEHPNRPILNGEDGVTVESGDATLSVDVSDPSQDSLKVGFYKGYRLSADEVNFRGYYNAIEQEPPTYIKTQGETAMNQQDIAAISNVDGDYLDSVSTKLPYHRFEINIGTQLARTDTVTARWYGKSLSGRRVTMYAWNLMEEYWEAVDFKIAGEGDFMLSADILIEYYVSETDRVLNLLVQDDLANRPKFSFAWFTDTQYYTQRNAFDDEDYAIYDTQVDWMITNKEKYNIKYAFHTGDIVNNGGQEYQWEIATQYMQKLDIAIPNGVLAGNHDVKFNEEDYTLYGKYFGEDRYKGFGYYGESYNNNKGHYDLIHVDGVDFIMLYMGWGVYEAEMNWMNKVLKSHPDKIAILNFHEYLGASGHRTALGEEIYQKVVVPNENVRMVLCGHIHGSSSRVDYLPGGREVLQMLADYQGLPNTGSKFDGGDGFMRMIEFNPATDNIKVWTISPWLEYFNTLTGAEEGDSNWKNQYKPEAPFYEGLTESGTPAFSFDPTYHKFTYAFPTIVTDKRVATDAIFVNYYSNELIGELMNVASGTTASINWAGDAAGGKQFWYAVVEDENGGKYISDVFMFNKPAAITKPDGKNLKALWITLGAVGGSAAVVGAGLLLYFYVFKKRRVNP